jgi:hypothetical protein
MKVINRSLSFGSDQILDVSNRSVPVIVGISVPVGVVLIALMLYCVFSRNNIDLPGSDYVPAPEITERTRRDTELQSL